MDKLARYLDPRRAADELRRLARGLGVAEFARVRNIDYVYAPYELYPLAARVCPPLRRVVAYVVDMDGTSTTTEPLALHALEYMVRRVTNRMRPRQWSGLDRRRDYPHVIGNSNFRHTEFLLERYRAQLDPAALRQAFFEAVCWTLANVDDPQRRRDVARNARACGLAELLADRGFQRLVAGGRVSAGNVGRLVAPFVRRYGPAFRQCHFGELVSAALDVYYMRYHAILRQIERGAAERLGAELLGAGGGQLLAPMPGYDVFIALVKGWLGREAGGLYELLRSALGAQRRGADIGPARLAGLGRRFRRRPARLGLVTASIRYEAEAVMKEVIRMVARRVGQWPLSAKCRDRIAAGLSDYRAVFDGFVNASGVGEHRLKPHRDLYSLALYQMSIPRSQYRFCVGLEDTEPGIIALRAAGIGCAVALPNRDTRRQDYAAAALLVRGGLPELILVHNLLLADEATA